ncbi:Uncharacterised protein [Kluyvera intermedia]|nr:Uncharacterised protein [Kluyvera intermedia]
MCKKVALTFIHTVLGEKRIVVSILNALGHNMQIQRSGHGDNGENQRL